MPEQMRRPTGNRQQRRAERLHAWTAAIIAGRRAAVDRKRISNKTGARPDADSRAAA